MNTKNLLMTSTVGMSRQDWLNFRSPLFHVENLIEQSTGRPKDVWTYQDLVMFFNGPAWGSFLFPCIGASEVSTVMGLNPYKSIIELYFEKIGAKDTFDGDNAAMFWGRELEEQIADKWQYWDGSEEGLIDNFTKGNVIRKCRKINYYVQNKAFPWIFVSLDRVINKSKANGAVVDEGSLECKTISGYAADMWESGIPPMYIAQLQTQITVLEFLFGEIALLKDGRKFDVIPFDKHEGISDNVKLMAEKFFNLVKEGVKHFLLYRYCDNEEQKQGHYSECERLSPEPDGSVAYENYLSGRFKDKGSGIPGGIIQLENAIVYSCCNEKIKQIETIQREASNTLKAFLGENNKIDFGANGTVTWKENAKGSRTFRVGVKVPEGYVPNVLKS